MNVDVRPMKTAAELALAATFAAARKSLPGSGAIAAMRGDAFRRFELEGLPHRRVEAWKYTDLRAAMREAKPLAVTADAAAKSRALEAGKRLADLDGRRIVFSDGVFVPDLSDLASLDNGLTITSMAEALASGDPTVTAHLGKVAEGDVAVALNTALMRDGVVIRVGAGAAIERPIHLIFALGERPSSVFTRSLVVIEKGARVMLVESHEGGSSHQVNTVIELVVGDEAHVDHVKLTDGADVIHVSSLLASVGAQARFSAFNFTTGGALVRNQLFLRFHGAGSIAGIRGASLLKGHQHVDNTIVADHIASGCQSREMFKAVLEGESRSVFQGKIIVQQAAQKTDAKMMTQALLLSDEAEADHKPELEIFADDVQCGHGATSGALDEDLKFYLMARGIPEADAEALLVQAFVGEAVEGIEDAGLRELLMDNVVAWLKARGG